MKRLIINPSNKKGIIAEIIGENGIRIQKRKTDMIPVNVFIKGKDYTVVANCTLTGEPVLIECIDGKIQEQDLTIIERKEENDKEKTNEEESGASGPESGDPGTNDESGDKGNPESGASGDDQSGANPDAVPEASGASGA